MCLMWPINHSLKLCRMYIVIIIVIIIVYYNHTTNMYETHIQVASPNVSYKDKRHLLINECLKTLSLHFVGHSSFIWYVEVILSWVRRLWRSNSESLVNTVLSLSHPAPHCDIISVPCFFLPARHYASVGMCYGISICLYVCLYVTCMLLSKRLNVLSKFFYRLIAQSFWFFVTKGHCLTSMASPLTEAPNIRGEKIRWFFTNKLVSLGSGARYGHSSYRSRIGNYTQAIEWCHVPWPWVAPSLSFKVTLQFEGEHLPNVACLGHNYCITGIGSHTQAIKWCHFWWP